MIFDLLGLDGREGAEPHVQSDEVGGNSPGAKIGEQRLREVQARSGRRHGARLAGKNGLVALPVQPGTHFIRPDVRRQRHLTEFAQVIGDVTRSRKANAPVAGFILFENGGREVGWPTLVLDQADGAALAQPSTRFEHHPPIVCRHGTQEEQLSLAGAFLPLTVQARGQNLCVVEDEQISGTEEIAQPRDGGMGATAGTSIHHQQARVFAAGGG